MAVFENGNGTNQAAVVDGHVEVQLRDASDATKVGAVVVYGESTDGIEGLPREILPTDVSHDYRLRVGVDKLRFFQDFGAITSAQSPVNFVLNSFTYTVTAGNGWYNVNATGSTAANAFLHMRSRAHFAWAQSQAMYIEGMFKISAEPATGQLFSVGLNTRADAATAAVTDGLCLERTAGGVWQLVWAFNGTLNAVALAGGWTPNPGIGYYCQMIASDKQADVYLNGRKYATVQRPQSLGTTFSNGPQPLAFFQSNGSGALASACQLSVGKWSIHSGDTDNERPIEMVNNYMGGWLARAPGGNTPSILNITNSAAPTSATLSNTAAGYTTFGGRFQFAAVAGAETDYLLFSYAVPSQSATGTAKTAIVLGFNIGLINRGAANSATVPTTVEFTFGYGASAATLVTVDGAATRAATRFILGQLSIPINAVVGQATDNIYVPVPSLPGEPGTQLQIIAKVVDGAATASQIIRGYIQPVGYWIQ